MGYVNYKWSERAEQARREGKFPATVLAQKLGIAASTITKYSNPCEWHHTGWFRGRVNSTWFYDSVEVCRDLREAFLSGSCKPRSNTRLWEICNAWDPNSLLVDLKRTSKPKSNKPKREKTQQEKEAELQRLKLIKKQRKIEELVRQGMKTGKPHLKNAKRKLKKRVKEIAKMIMKNGFNIIA